MVAARVPVHMYVYSTATGAGILAQVPAHADLCLVVSPFRLRFYQRKRQQSHASVHPVGHL